MLVEKKETLAGNNPVRLLRTSRSGSIKLGLPFDEHIGILNIIVGYDTLRFLH